MEEKVDYPATPKEIYDSAKAVEERFKLKRKNAEELDLSIEDIEFIEDKLKYIKEYLDWYSQNLL